MRTSAGYGLGMVCLAMLPIPILTAIYFLVTETGLVDAIAIFFLFGFWVLFVSLLATLLFGLPTHYLLSKVGLFNWPIVISVGAVVGVAVGLLLFPYGSQSEVALIFGSLGAYGALSYWYGASRLFANKALNSQASPAGTPKDGAH